MSCFQKFLPRFSILVPQFLSLGSWSRLIIPNSHHNCDTTNGKGYIYYPESLVCVCACLFSQKQYKWTTLFAWQHNPEKGESNSRRNNYPFCWVLLPKLGLLIYFHLTGTHLSYIFEHLIPQQVNQIKISPSIGNLEQGRKLRDYLSSPTLFCLLRLKTEIKSQV